MFNKNFYPTPATLIQIMWYKVDRTRVGTILEPSAGKGDILDYIKNLNPYSKPYKFAAIELENDLRATLTGKGYRVIDSDYLAYCGLDRFDLIIGNPPFDHGDLHLLKAISMMENGQIVFLLNAETLKNPCTNTRKLLVQKLEELNASVEYIQNAFIDAERKTAVEVALVYISIEKQAEENLFDGCTDNAQAGKIEFDATVKDVASRNTVEFAVEEFNEAVRLGTEAILAYFKARRLCERNLTLYSELDRSSYEKGNINELFNSFLSSVRKTYWLKILDIPEVKKRMTTSSIKEFNDRIQKQADMDFTERNIRQFIQNLFGDYNKILSKAVAEMFENFTDKFSYNDECSHNIHYFNGWKTNKAFYANKKVVVPYNRFTASYFGPFDRGHTNWDLERFLTDIDLVMNYFTASDDFVSINEAVNKKLAECAQDGNGSGIFGTLLESTHFLIRFYKKGTMHLTFKDEGTLRRFNITACKEKNWLPQDYGRKKYADMTSAEKEIVESFEGKESYNTNLNKIGFTKETLMIEETA